MYRKRSWSMKITALASGTIIIAYRFLSALGVIDTRNPNVVVVLTHATNVLRKPSDASKMYEKKRLILDAAQSHLGFRPEIAVIENDLEHAETADETEWTALPDGTYQPLNLYEAIVAMLEKNRDELAVASVNCFFKIADCKGVKPEKCLQVDARVADKDDVTMDWLESSFRNFVNIDHLASAKNTEVWQNIFAVADDAPANKREHYELLCLNLFSKGFRRSQDFAHMSVGEVAWKLRPYALSSEDEAMLMKAFSLERKVTLKYFSNNVC